MNDEYTEAYTGADTSFKWPKGTLNHVTCEDCVHDNSPDHCGMVPRETPTPCNLFRPRKTYVPA